MRRLIVSTMCAVVFGAIDAHAYYDPYVLDRIYVKVAGYEVGFSEKHGLCIAKRTISIRDREGFVLRGGFFAYGIGEHGTGYASVIIISNPHWEFQVGRSAPGRVAIDEKIFGTVFRVDSEHIVSTTLPEYAVGNIARSREIRFTGAQRSYMYRPINAQAPLPALLHCSRASLKTLERQRKFFGGTPPQLP